MTILLISHSSNYYGAEQSLFNLAKGLILKNNKLIVLCPSEGELTNHLRQINAKVSIMPLPGIGQRNVSQLIFFILHWLPTIIKLKKFISDKKISLVYNNTINGIYAPFAAWLAGVPCIWHIREVRPKYRFFRFFFSFLFRKITCYTIFNSIATMKSYSSTIWSNWKVVYNGVDIPVKTRQKISKINNPIVIGFAGQMVSHKRPEFFLQAFKLAEGSIPNIKGSMAGDGDLLPRIKFISSKLGIKDKIAFHGYLLSMSTFYRDIDIMVLTSEKEPFGRVVIEAMSYGCPVIASRVGGVKEIIKNNETGYLVNKNDISAFAEKIIALAKDYDLRYQMGELARESVSEKFSLDSYVSNMCNLINQAMRNSV
jgi:glycosyltransferase involved in cell wall biosynthesis